MSTPTFQDINQHLGWGDAVLGGVWFVAIEEGGPQFKDLSAREQAYFSDVWEPYDPPIKGRPCPLGTSIQKIQESILRDTFLPQVSSPQEYVNNVLWRPGSKVLTANLYSLPRPNMSTPLSWPLPLTDLKTYYTSVRRDRWPSLLTEHSRLQPQVTIFLGKSCWKEFREAFHLKSSPSGSERVEVHSGRRFIFAHHWAARGSARLSKIDIEGIRSQLKIWDVKLPGVLPAVQGRNDG